MLTRLKASLILVGYITLSTACTTFASFNGESKSIIMAKNRDNRPDRQVLEVVADAKKYKYLALSRQDVPEFVAAGVNQKNLAVFNEVSVEYSALAKGGIADDFSRDILQNYQHAVDVIPDISKLVAKFPDPVFYQVMDKEYILNIEVAQNQQYSFQLIKRGSFVHTNNFLIKELVKNYPYTPAEKIRYNASNKRLQRAAKLIKSESSFSLDNMQQIALDHFASANDSIFRTGAENTPNSVRSLAFFAVQIAKNGQEATKIQANLYNMGETYKYILNDVFWDKYTTGTTILNSNAK